MVDTLQLSNKIISHIDFSRIRKNGFEFSLGLSLSYSAL